MMYLNVFSNSFYFHWKFSTNKFILWKASLILFVEMFTCINRRNVSKEDEIKKYAVLNEITIWPASILYHKINKSFWHFKAKVSS